MLKYDTLNKFYTGDKEELFTPLTSDYLNSIITQIEINSKDLDKRLMEIEGIINDNELNIQFADIKVCKTQILTTVNGEIDNLKSDKLNCKNSEIEKLNVEDADIQNTNIQNLKVQNSNFSNTNIDYAKINQLFLNSLDISDKYTFEKNYIHFKGEQPSLKFNINENCSNGLRFDSTINESYARIEFTNKNNQNNFELEFFSANENDKFIIKSKQIDIHSNLILDGNIIPKDNNSIGNANNPFEEIYGKEIYGSYYSYNADLAELYETDNLYEEGTILQIGIETEGTIADGTRPILGIVSNKYAILLNNNDSRKTLPIALKGRVFCKLSKKGKRGDYIIVDKNNPGFGIPIDKKPTSCDIVGILIDPEKNIVKV